MLTVFTVERSGCGFGKIIKAMEGMDVEFIPVMKGDSCTKFHSHSKDWYMILFDDEIPDEKLVRALPEYLTSGYDFFEVYFIMYTDSDPRYFVQPRLFKKDVILNKHGEVVDSDSKLFTSILDGWVVRDGTNS